MAREFLWLQRKRNRFFDIWQPLLRKQTDEKQKKKLDLISSILFKFTGINRIRTQRLLKFRQYRLF